MVGKSLPLLAVMTALVLFPGTAAAEPKGGAKTGKEIVKYRYEAMPKGGSADQKEFGEITVADSGRNLEYGSKLIAPGTEEDIRLTVTREGRFVAGTRNLADRSRNRASHERIWREGDKAYLEELQGERKKIREFELSREKELAVDGSLLILMRSFPFGQGKEWSVFMVDFSGASVTVTVRQAGTERVAVPAGVFECYRMDVIVNILFFHPKMTYWIAAAEPHFLVKHEGKRGPFTPYYSTSLVAVE